MQTVKKTKDYTIVKKRSGRYGVLTAKDQWLKGEEKVKILLAEKLIKLTPPKKKEAAATPAPAPAAT